MLLSSGEHRRTYNFFSFLFNFVLLKTWVVFLLDSKHNNMVCFEMQIAHGIKIRPRKGRKKTFTELRSFDATAAQCSKTWTKVQYQEFLLFDSKAMCMSHFTWHLCRSGAILLPFSHLSCNYLLHLSSIFNRLWNTLGKKSISHFFIWELNLTPNKSQIIFPRL